jgi:acyl carrier protein
MREVKALEMLAGEDRPETVGKLREQPPDIRSSEFADPESFWALGDDLSYAVEISWSDLGVRGCLDVLLERRPGLGKQAYGERPLDFAIEQARLKPWRQYANMPMRTADSRRLIPQLCGYLQERLPPYMVPSAFVFVDALPLSPNGKIDRRALPAPDPARPELEGEYAAPRTPLEEVLAGIWCEVLGLERVGVHDNFFELGGHSLTATQVISRINDAFQCTVSVRTIFDRPCVAKLAEAIEAIGRESHADMNEIARILLRVNQLSDEEVKTMLAKRESPLQAPEEIS